MDHSSVVRVKTEKSDTNVRTATVPDNNYMDHFFVGQVKIQDAQFPDAISLAEAVKAKEIIYSFSHKAYTYKKILSDEGGEGIVVVCENEFGQDVAVKVYSDVKNMSLERRKKIIEFTRSDDAEKYVLPISDMGFVELQEGTKNYFEVQPLCMDGDLLSKGKFSYKELVDIIKELNEGLHYIHEKGFLHMDIKPENIYRYNGHYVFGDFGIARELKGGQSVTQFTHVGKIISGTPGYQAPEVLYGTAYYKMTSKTDYYSLGVTIASMYLGRFVFLNNGEFDPVAFQESAQSSHIDLGNENDENTYLLQNLVDGLFQFDQNKRFGYEDVNKWIANPFYEGEAGKGSIDKNIKWSSPFQGSSKSELFYSEKEMYVWMASNWEEAKQRLYTMDIETHLQKNNEAYVRSQVRNIREIKYPLQEDSDMAVFETCLEIYSETDAPLIWKGEQWDSLQSLANDIIENDSPESYAKIFENQLISYWLNKTGMKEVDEKLRSLIGEIEKSAKINSWISCYWFAFIFAGKCEISIGDSCYSTPADMLRDMISSAYNLYKENGVISYMLDLKRSYKAYGFICSGGQKRIGCADFVLQFIDNLPDAIDEREHLLFVLFEKIAIALNDIVLLEKIRRAYLLYGPYGDIRYIHYLVKNKDYYFSDKKEGEAIIRSIKSMPEAQIEAVGSMGKYLVSLKKHTDNLFVNMQNNPILAQAGIFQGKTIKCNNLQGFFIYEFLGRNVPLGYRDIVEAKE